MKTTIKTQTAHFSIEPCSLNYCRNHVTFVAMRWRAEYKVDDPRQLQAHAVLSPAQTKALIAALEATLKEASGVVA